MEQHRDEHIDCADCGASFVFSADEAAVFVERGLAAPKRCKECRRARKERAANGAPRGSGPGFPSSSQRVPANSAPGNSFRGRAAAPRYGAPQRRYTGDVNEYRSPMQDGFSGAPYQTALRAAAPWQRSGEYRSPMQDGFHDGGSAPKPPAKGFVRRGPNPFDPRPPRPTSPDGGPRAGQGARAESRAISGNPAEPFHDGAASGPKPRAPAEPPRRRAQAEMFAITCDTCGAQAEVPFKPAEGREVYCAACYRARRPSV
jgi:CxxC-x17-CxxC domain-containing protein